MPYRVVFMGTPEFAVPTLQALIDAPDFEVVGVVTQPDREAGRGKHLRASPIKELALRHDLAVFQPEKLRGDVALDYLKSWDADFFVVAAYGQILKPSVLNLPRYGCINVHASLLPRWRGAAPIQYAILAGDTVTGITTMQMDAGLDTGPMLKKVEIPIKPYETSQTLHDKLAAAGGPLLIETLRGVVSGAVKPQSQEDSLATYAPRIEKEAGHIQWTDSAVSIERRIRAFTPWPGTYAFLDAKMLKILAGKVLLDNPHRLASGEISTQDSHAPLVIGTGEGHFVPTLLQLEGRKPVEAKDFLNGMPPLHGMTLR